MRAMSHISGRLEILIVDDEASIRLMLSVCLKLEGHQVATAGTIDEALQETNRQGFDLIFLDVRLGLDNGLDFIPQLLSKNPWTRIVIITAYASMESALRATELGASDYLPKPFTPAQVVHVTQKVTERRQLERTVQALQATMGAMDAVLDFPAVDPPMIDAVELARRVATSHANLLIFGEIGSGKARLAQAIHRWSDRASQPFATLSCRAGDEGLETDLFGQTGGGAAGKLEFCQGGTLLLEQVNEIPLRLQPRMLRLLKEREFERGDETTRRRVDVRIITTTSADLQQAVAAGSFRSDLLLAMNVVQINLPPLRDRPNELPLLARQYLAFFSQKNHRAITGFTPEAIYALRQHRWPGNVWELRNVIERAVLLCTVDCIGVEHLPPNLLNTTSYVQIGDLIPLSIVEELHVRRVVESARSLRQAATILGIDAGTVVRRMKRYGSDEQADA
jgi:NtrC-family two-component system response regulator AlgB